MVEDLHVVLRASAAVSPHVNPLYLVVLRDLNAGRRFTYAALALYIATDYRDEKPLACPFVLTASFRLSLVVAPPIAKPPPSNLPHLSAWPPSAASAAHSLQLEPPPQPPPQGAWSAAPTGFPYGGIHD
ncbi:hypothetical protein CYMTET_49050 [Cymbomonas tetramitiformis]|uniref:Uncharacterized protein n=1 Tax=Cymbomonas tetramitiformis TaxID=36881 RepID=A0AAE0EUI6_9CHLO|nr:hypothetical protein CYMTET_49050 [Cymbomonas tetramitiformis]